MHSQSVFPHPTFSLIFLFIVLTQFMSKIQISKYFVAYCRKPLSYKPGSSISIATGYGPDGPGIENHVLPSVIVYIARKRAYFVWI
jgi:hypothetical protein